MDLFDTPDSETDAPPQPSIRPERFAHQPLAERMRPRAFAEWVGQESVAGATSPLRRMLELRRGDPQGRLTSMIFWGPPGCGKTTLARLIASEANMAFEPLSAVTSGVKDVKAVIDRATLRRETKQRGTLLFIDEIHRFNKAQQDAFLPHVENGLITLIGATTENPSFAVIAPLLSRCRVLTLHPLGEAELLALLRRALSDVARGLGTEAWQTEDGLLEKIAGLADGDARRALGLLEQCTLLARAEAKEGSAGSAQDAPETVQKPMRLSLERLKIILERDHLTYDKSGEEHFNLMSAFHKSMRASEPQAAVYWMFRMLEAGEDPLWIARRIIACAAEDIGLADPQALQQAVAALQALQAIGLPEGELPLTQAAIYVATAPKSNSVNVARMGAKAAAQAHGPLAVPLHLRNAPTGLMKELGYGREYQYDHDSPDHFSGQPCLPEDLARKKFYEPGGFGFEREIRKRLDWWDRRREESGGQ